MSPIQSWLQTPGARALGWTLVHSVWEGAIVALVLAGALWAMRGSRARYAAACLALLILLGGFGATFATLLVREQNASAAFRRSGSTRLAKADRNAGAQPIGAPGQLGINAYLVWLAPFWMAGVAIFHVRSVAGWARARRLRRKGVCCAPDLWQQRLRQLAARLRVSEPVVLWESCLADVPLVIGYLRPVILTPVGMLAGMTVAQVEALLLHELAHIRRYDYVVNLAQVFVEGLLFYHPAVWWISGVIRAEREHCCDDLVVAMQGDAYQYCTALAALEHNRAEAQTALAANGGSIVKRIRRLLIQPETPSSPLVPVFSAAILMIAAAISLPAWQATPRAGDPGGTPARPTVESPYRRWLTEDVAYIIKDEERAAFKKLLTNEEREHFIEQFWLRRDPTPGTPENEFKQEHYRRIAYTNEHFAAGIAGWKTDRGRVYITYGPPDEKESHPAGGKYPYPYEQWLYHYIDGIGKDIIVEFVDPSGTGEYRMTMDPHATVQVLGGMAAISIPLGRYEGHPVNISGRVLAPDGKLVTSFEETVAGRQDGYVKTIPLPPGQAYRIEYVVKDLATGKNWPDRVQFEMK